MEKIQRKQLHLTLIYFIPFFILIISLASFILINQRRIADTIRYSLSSLGTKDLYYFPIDTELEKMDYKEGKKPKKYVPINFSNPPSQEEIEYLSLDEYNKFMDVMYTNLLWIVLVVTPILLIMFAYLAHVLATWVLKPLVDNQKRQKRFIDDASHELRTPVSLMRLELDMEKKRKETKTDRQKKMMANINNSVLQLESIISNLLSYVRLGQIDVVNEQDQKINLSLLFTEVFGQFEQLLDEKKMTYTLDISDNIFVYTKKSLFRQLLLIGVDNAIKHSELGEKINFSLSESQKAIHILIKNPVPHNKIIDFEKLSDRFYRADQARTKSGLGLGLSIAHDISEKIDGKLNLRSEDKKFVFEFIKNN